MNLRNKNLIFKDVPNSEKKEVIVYLGNVKIGSYYMKYSNYHLDYMFYLKSDLPIKFKYLADSDMNAKYMYDKLVTTFFKEIRKFSRK